MIKNKKILSYIKIIITTYILHALFLEFLYEECKPNYWMGELKNTPRLPAFYIGLLYYFITLIILIISCIKYSKQEKKEEKAFQIYKKSKTYKLHKLINIFSLILCVYCSVVTIESRSFEMEDIGLRIQNGLFYFYKFVIHYASIYFVLFWMESNRKINSCWFDREKQIIILEEYLNGIRDEFHYKIVLFEDKNNIIENYFSEKSLDMEYEKNISFHDDSVGYIKEIFSMKDEGIIYLSKNYDIPFLAKLFPNVDIEAKLRPHIFVYLNTVSKDENYDEAIYRFKEKCEKEYNDIHIRQILVYEKLGSYKKPSELEYIDFLQIFDKNDYYIKIKNLYSYDIEFTEPDLKETNFKLIRDFKPSNGYNLYKNAFLCESKYQEMLLLFNYMVYMTQIIAYYIYLKHNEGDANKVNPNILTDSYDKLFQFILDNVSETDYLYQSIKSKIKLSESAKNTLLSNITTLLDIGIEQNDKYMYISFAGLGDLLTLLRNKIQSHGNVNEENINQVIEVMELLVLYFNYFLCMDKFEINNQGKKVYIKYDKETPVYLGNYLICIDGVTLVVQKKSRNSKNYRYMDYFKGKYCRPEDVEIDSKYYN